MFLKKGCSSPFHLLIHIVEFILSREIIYLTINNKVLMIVKKVLNTFQVPIHLKWIGIKKKKKNITATIITP